MSSTFYCPCGYSYKGDGQPDYDHDPGDSCCNCGGRKCMDCVSRAIHDHCENSCPFCCPEFGERLEAEALARAQSRIDELVEKHRWNGGYSCGCGADMNSPQTWSRHVLEDALVPHLDAT